MLPIWVQVFRCGVVPQLSLACLEKLAWTLHTGDFLRGETVYPSGCLYMTQNMQPQAACPLGSALWHGRNLVTTGQVQDDFHSMMDRADHLCFIAEIFDLGACPSAKLIEFIDSEDKDKMRAEFLAEVNLAILEKGGTAVL